MRNSLRNILNTKTRYELEKKQPKNVLKHGVIGVLVDVDDFGMQKEALILTLQLTL